MCEINLFSSLVSWCLQSYKAPFQRPFGEQARADAARQRFAQHKSDHLAIVEAFGAWRNKVNNWAETKDDGRRGTRGAIECMKLILAKNGGCQRTKDGVAFGGLTNICPVYIPVKCPRTTGLVSCQVTPTVFHGDHPYVEHSDLHLSL